MSSYYMLLYALGHLGSHLYSFPLETYLGFVELNRSKGAMMRWTARARMAEVLW